ncbi:unannotated protein [freshwater metagenome]|uniref:Unannotated protein n=1 Tax=freshwater metagenome TaxID=449393 RepID=A0A6J7EYQ8_9ZZZZ
MVTHAAGWYPDPIHRFEYRYYNGTAWTGDVSVAGHRYIDPLPGTALGAGGAGGAAWAPQRGPTTARPRAIAALALALSSILTGWVPFLCAVALVAAILAVVFGFSALARSRAEQQTNPHNDGRRMALASIMLAPIACAVCGVGIWLTVVTVREFDQFSYVGTYAVTTTRCAVQADAAHFEGTITNESDTTQSYHLMAEFLRAGTTNVLYTAGVDITGVAPGATQPWSIEHTVTVAKLDCRISAVTGPLPFADAQVAPHARRTVRPTVNVHPDPQVGQMPGPVGSAATVGAE